MNHHYTQSTTPYTGNPYIQNTPAPPPTTAVNTLNTLGRKVESATKKAENLAENLYTHYRTGPGLVDVTKSRLNQTARFLFDGSANVFKREFGLVYGEQLKKTYACYLSIPGGPVLGTMYISNWKVCFRSDAPVWTGPGDGPGKWVYYKVAIEMNRVETVNQMANGTGEKYIEIVTKDGKEFWFMGFVFYENALKNLYEVVPHAPVHVTRY
ncbi:hypothetical protein vseg_017666 [Gypsophila vaccaria]